MIWIIALDHRRSQYRLTQSQGRLSIHIIQYSDRAQSMSSSSPLSLARVRSIYMSRETVDTHVHITLPAFEVATLPMLVMSQPHTALAAVTSRLPSHDRVLRSLSPLAASVVYPSSSVQ